MGTRSVEADQGITTTIAHVPPRIVHGLHPTNAGYEKVPWRSVGRCPITVPMVAVRQATQFGHLVDVLDPPPGPGLLEATAHQVLGRPLHHPAADRLARVQPMAVVQPAGMRCEVARP